MRAIKLQVVFLMTITCLVQTVVAQEITFSPVRVIQSDFNFPTDICGNEAGDVFVLDGMNDRVVELKVSGEVTVIKPQRESIYKAVGIAWINGSLWIADTPRSRLLRMETDGRISQLVRLDHQTEPVDVSAIGDNIVVTDRRNHAITVLDQDYKEKYYWGKRGAKVGEFINPGFLAPGPENRIIIGDILNRRVLSFSPSGRYPQIIAKPGVEIGQIFRPKGVALDSKNRIWVADGYTGAIQAFSVSGNFQGIASSEGKNLALSAPMGIFIDKQDRAWIVESFSNKVSVWRIK
jgi:DNA-binding beta-propeller fold protein YncE